MYEQPTKWELMNMSIIFNKIYKTKIIKKWAWISIQIMMFQVIILKKNNVQGSNENIEMKNNKIVTKDIIITEKGVTRQHTF